MGRIVVLGTGGTIAGRAAAAADDLGYTAAQVGIAQLLQGVGALQGRAWEAEQVVQVDSKDMDPPTWVAIASRCQHWLAQADVDALVLTHGTDTMEETAWLLHCVLDSEKPVVLTGAMRPATSLAPDGPGNLEDAIHVAADPAARGVVVVFAGRIHGAPDVAKVHTRQLDAFSCGDAGALGRVAQGVVAWDRKATLPCRASSVARIARLPWPRVDIVLNHAGADGELVRLLVGAGARGIVAAGTGNGTLRHELEAALVQAQAAGVRVVRASRCAGGGVAGHTGDKLPHAGALSAVKARISLALELLG